MRVVKVVAAADIDLILQLLDADFLKEMERPAVKTILKAIGRISKAPAIMQK